MDSPRGVPHLPGQPDPPAAGRRTARPVLDPAAADATKVVVVDRGSVGAAARRGAARRGDDDEVGRRDPARPCDSEGGERSDEWRSTETAARMSTPCG